MYCLDCLGNERERDVVGVCHSCGAGVCIDHVAIVPVHLTRIGVILREERIEPAARELLCPTCLAARQAADNPYATTRRHGAREEAATVRDKTRRSHSKWRRETLAVDEKHQANQGRL